MLSQRDKAISKSYNDWGYKECVSYIYAHITEDPIDVCERFRHIMDKAAMEAKTETSKMIFASGYEAATHILDDLIIEKEGGKII